ncbi:acyl carrier protein [Arenibacterium sp. CAU 1754]
MKPDEIRKIFLQELTFIAPDIDPETVRGSDHLQDDLELDSMDILNLVAAIDKRLGVSVPEIDYPQIETPDKAVEYLAGKLG